MQPSTRSIPLNQIQFCDCMEYNHSKIFHKITPESQKSVKNQPPLLCYIIPLLLQLTFFLFYKSSLRGSIELKLQRSRRGGGPYSFSIRVKLSRRRPPARDTLCARRAVSKLFTITSSSSRPSSSSSSPPHAPAKNQCHADFVSLAPNSLLLLPYTRGAFLCLRNPEFAVLAVTIPRFGNHKV